MSRNDITGDNIVSKANSDAFRDGHERIYGKKERPTWAAPIGHDPHDFDKIKDEPKSCMNCGAHCDYADLRTCGLGRRHWQPKVD